MRRSLNVALIILVLGLGSWSPENAADSSTFEQMASHYEAIRLALLHDGLEGVPESAREIKTLATGLGDGLAPETAGIRPEAVEELRKLLPSIRETSDRIAVAETISDARGSFAALSEALVRYRRLVADPAPAVAFCPMAQKVWLQPDGEIGNPYYGQSMARCGEFVSQ